LSVRLLGLVVIFAAIWCAYWLVAYYLAQTAVGEAAAADGEANPLVACADHGFGGFPFQLTVNCRGVSAETGGGVRASLGQFAAAAPLYTPGRVKADIAGPFRLVTPDFAVGAAWAAADATLDAGLIGPTAAAANFTDVQLLVEDRAGVTGLAARAGVWGTELRPSATAEAIEVALTTDELVITIDGNPFPAISGNARLTLLESGAQLDQDPMGIVRTWLTAGGAFQVEELHLAVGRVRADISGPMVLELDGTLTGELTIRYSGVEDLALLVAAVFPWQADMAEALAGAIVALSRPVGTGEHPQYETRWNVRHGAVNYGLIPIPNLTIPSIGDLHHLL
jgi:hypothetical protein